MKKDEIFYICFLFIGVVFFIVFLAGLFTNHMHLVAVSLILMLVIYCLSLPLRYFIDRGDSNEKK